MPNLRSSSCVLLLLQLCTFVLCTSPPASSDGHVASEETVPVSGSSQGMLPHLEEPSAAENPDLDFVKRLYDFGLGKRAYSYVSEYKRLPVYNFGLGKRSKMYGFGLGKRAAPGADGRLYSFGLGKRDYDDYYEDGGDEEDQSSGNEDLDDSDIDLVDKRERLYSFGLGKRARPYSFGLGKRSPSGVQHLYGFGLGKRGNGMYSFGLGKRADGRLYSFGLGKRPVSTGRQSGSRFNFGLGKRSDDFDIRDVVDDELIEEPKRTSQGHRFSFGLGKREVTPSELEAVKNEQREKEVKSVADEKNEGNHHNGERVKRSLHYAFGLGKRASLYDVDDDEGSDGDDFARFGRRQFNFGLGKRIPMYDFGIGKRSER